MCTQDKNESLMEEYNEAYSAKLKEQLENKEKLLTMIDELFSYINHLSCKEQVRITYSEFEEYAKKLRKMQEIIKEL